MQSKSKCKQVYLNDEDEYLKNYNPVKFTQYFETLNNKVKQQTYLVEKECRQDSEDDISYTQILREENEKVALVKKVSPVIKTIKEIKENHEEEQIENYENDEIINRIYLTQKNLTKYELKKKPAKKKPKKKLQSQQQIILRKNKDVDVLQESQQLSQIYSEYLMGKVDHYMQAAQYPASLLLKDQNDQFISVVSNDISKKNITIGSTVKVFFNSDQRLTTEKGVLVIWCPEIVNLNTN